MTLWGVHTCSIMAARGQGLLRTKHSVLHSDDLNWARGNHTWPSRSDARTFNLTLNPPMAGLQPLPTRSASLRSP
jgi:hypothetical protein